MPVDAPEAPAANAVPPAAPATPAAVAPPAPAATPAVVTPPSAPDSKNTILGGSQEPPKEAQKQGSPEKYIDFTLPEGVEFKAEVLEGFKTTAKELGLSQESAQKLIDLQANSVKAEVDGRLAAFDKQVEEWKAESNNAFGPNADAQFVIASKAVDRFGSPELRKLLNETGLGNHPELVKFFAKVGNGISEDPNVDGRRAGGEVVSTADLLYPTMKKP